MYYKKLYMQYTYRYNIQFYISCMYIQESIFAHLKNFQVFLTYEIAILVAH